MPPFVLASEIEPGRYVCTRTKSPFGFLIRIFTRSPYDHAFIVLGGGLIAEATNTGTRIDNLDRYKGQLAVANTDELMTTAQRAQVAQAARQLVGREYGWGAIGVIALRKLGLKWGWLLRFADEKDADICSEDVAIAGAAAGLDWLCGEEDPALVRPDELAARKPYMCSVAWD
jgi:hypothetical protein